MLRIQEEQAGETPGGTPASGSDAGVVKRRRQELETSTRPARLQDLSRCSGARPSEPFAIQEPLCSKLNFLALEVFAGSGHLSEALRRVGCSVARIDIRIGGAAHDLSKGATVAAVKALRPQYVHLAPCCNTYSAARYPKLRTKLYPEGKPDLDEAQRSIVKLANRVTNNTVRLCEHFCAEGTPWSVENPHGSVLWWTKG